MSDLLERVKLNLLVYGDGIADNFKNNSIYFYQKYSQSDKQVTSIRPESIQFGGFYHLCYKDESNWMKFSPVFTVGAKETSIGKILIAVNLNFIPIEVRVAFFEKFVKDEDLDNDRLLPADFEGVYNELLKYGFEYSLMEYQASRIVLTHKINMNLLPRFLYSGYPTNKYDPKKLYEIWKAKISRQRERDQEMRRSLISDFVNASDDILENYKQLRGHIERLQRGIEKFG